MKRKLTNAQMQESVAELTDDVTELKAERQKTNAWKEGADRQFAAIFEVLDQTAETIRQTAVNQQRYERQADERMRRVEATVQKISDMVDRYLSARLNGGSQN